MLHSVSTLDSIRSGNVSNFSSNKIELWVYTLARFRSINGRKGSVCFVKRWSVQRITSRRKNDESFAKNKQKKNKYLLSFNSDTFYVDFFFLLFKDKNKIVALSKVSVALMEEISTEKSLVSPLNCASRQKHIFSSLIRLAFDDDDAYDLDLYYNHNYWPVWTQLNYWTLYTRRRKTMYFLNKNGKSV